MTKIRPQQDRDKNMSAPLEIFLLIGQSNMAGRGRLGAVPALRHPSVRVFRNGQWIPAEEPLHTDNPAIVGIGLGMSFAVARLESRPEAVIGLVPCAVGGTPLRRWMPGADLYVGAVAMTGEALPFGSLKGVLWHQGENDVQQTEDAANYGCRLSEMIGALRSDLNAPHVPFVAGELGEFLKDDPPSRDCFREINAQLLALCGRVPQFGCASSFGLTDAGDHIHFDSLSLREFGRRYASEYRRIVESQKGDGHVD